MEKIKKLLVLCLFTIMLTPVSSAMSFELLDGRITDGKGRIQQTLMMRTHRDARDVQFNSFRTMFRLEGLLHLADTENHSFKFFGNYNYWYDFAASVDSGLKRAIRNENGGGNGLKRFRQSRQEWQIIKESYLDWEIYPANLNLRIGKQIVTWGETSESRVADVINPIDFSNLVAYPDWKDYKIGLWMLRAFFYPRLPGNITFEFLAIPKWESLKPPPGGTGFWLGTPINPLTGRLLHEMRQSEPANNLKNTELGFKVRGLIQDLDWTLSVFYHRFDGPGLIRGRKGFTQFQRMMQGYTYGRIFEYPWYTTIAQTAAKPLFGGILSNEITVNINQPYQYGAFERKDKNLFVSALTYDKNYNWPWLVKINKGVSIITSFTWYHYKVLNFERDSATGATLNWEGPKRHRSSWDKLSGTIQTSFLDHTLLTGVMATYDITNNTTDFVVRLMYFPGDHFFYELSYQQVNERTRQFNRFGDTRGPQRDMQDQVILNVRYEF